MLADEINGSTFTPHHDIAPEHSSVFAPHVAQVTSLFCLTWTPPDVPASTSCMMPGPRGSAAVVGSSSTGGPAAPFGRLCRCCCCCCAGESRWAAGCATCRFAPLSA